MPFPPTFRAADRRPDPVVEDRLRRLGRGLGLIVGVLAALVTLAVMGASTAGAAEPDGPTARQAREAGAADSGADVDPREGHDTTDLQDRPPAPDTDGEAPAVTDQPSRRSAADPRATPERSRQADAAGDPVLAPAASTAPSTIVPTVPTPATTAPVPSDRTWNADRDGVDSAARADDHSGRGARSDDGVAVGDDPMAADARSRDRDGRRRSGRWDGAPDRGPESRGDQRNDDARAVATDPIDPVRGRDPGVADPDAPSSTPAARTPVASDLPTAEGWDMASLHRLSEFSAAIVPELSWTSMVQERPDTAVPDTDGSTAGTTPWGRAFAEGGQISAAGGAMAFAAVLFQREGDPAPPEWRLLDEERSPHLPCFYESNRVPG